MRTPWSLVILALAASSAAYRVDIQDTDEVREVCSGMFGGKAAHIDVTFDPRSSGQVALVIYEWADVAFLGTETPDETKTYICTTSAVRSGACSKADLGAFITTLPQGKTLNDTSIFTTGLRFEADAFGGDEYELGGSTHGDDEVVDMDPFDDISDERPSDDFPETENTDIFEDSIPEDPEALAAAIEEAQFAAEDTGFQGGHVPYPGESHGKRRLPALRIGFPGRTGSAKRQFEDDLGLEDLGFLDGGEATDAEEEALEEELQEIMQEIEAEESEGLDGVEGADDGEYNGNDEGDYPEYEPETTSTSSSRISKPTSAPKRPSAGLENGVSDGPSKDTVPVYRSAITYAVPKTGYYCVGVVPVTLVTSKRSAEHAEYAGSVLFKNVFEGELPAAEYPKIGFYGFLSVVYALLAAGWGYLCFQNRRELLPMQYYISGTIVFLVMEMLANFAYYRYINKNGGGSGSMAFLFVVAALNAARNSLSFFLLLITSMGLSVVTPSLGSIMNRVRLLTALHFVFGVIYAIGTVQVELESASLFIVLFMIFPLALTLTAFLMWTIISLNGTITHLAARKQRHKLQMFKRLYRILMLSVIAVAAFFVISSLSLSNRLEEDYAPRNWKYRWILLDASLAIIYLAAFAAIAWLWRPSRDNVRFAMSQELAQDENDADDYEFGSLENRPVQHDDDYDMDDEQRGFISNGRSHAEDGFKSENVVFALEDEDSDDDRHHARRSGQFRDEEEAAEAEGDVGRSREREKGKLD
ncbi:hypothetical protein NCC49_002628 [Naganishia albida]|nr:hypothetical protein NCC49_002628 [Naganishia albida]